MSRLLMQMQCVHPKACDSYLKIKIGILPNTAEVKNMLTDIEKKNISLIKKYEKYAKEFGDELDDDRFRCMQVACSTSSFSVNCNWTV